MKEMQLQDNKRNYFKKYMLLYLNFERVLAYT